MIENKSSIFIWSLRACSKHSNLKLEKLMHGNVDWHEHWAEHIISQSMQTLAEELQICSAFIHYTHNFVLMVKMLSMCAVVAYYCIVVFAWNSFTSHANHHWVNNTSIAQHFAIFICNQMKRKQFFATTIASCFLFS